MAETIEEFDRVRAQLLAAVAEADPAGDTMAPPAPSGTASSTPALHARYYLVHFVEEWSRHAGHADIIREQIDGAPGNPPGVRPAGLWVGSARISERSLLPVPRERIPYD
ncbi:DUF664 domain-containing protein [Pseudonocardia sp. C8]|uniref:mycothiol transferase n=1 Tax=Pseudonocardia sp. C8 TaxID=2762759 RepID=UPI00351BF8C7